MKKYLLVLMATLIIQVPANSVPWIEIEKVNWDKDDRSASLLPSIKVDQGLLSIHFITPLQDLQIQIYNECGVLIYEDTISGVFGENYFIPLGDGEHHSYMIQLSHTKLGVQNHLIPF